MKHLLITITTILTTSLAVQAQVQTNGELKSLINKSFGYFPKIKETENGISTAEERLAATKLNKMPDVNAQAAYNYIRPKITIPIDGNEFQFAPVHSVNTSLDASYMLFDFGRLKANVERSKTDLQYAKHNVDYAKTQVANQVAVIYYNIVYLQKAVSIQDSVLSYLSDNKAIVDSKLRNGDALKIDLLNIQASIDAAQNQKADVQNALQKQLNLLEYTTGSNLSNGKGFDFDLNLVDVNTALGIAQTNNTDFVLAKDRIAQAQADVALTKITDRPSVNIHGSTGFKNGYVPYVGDMRFNYTAGVSLLVPIYNGGKVKQQTKLAQTLVKQNELAVETLNNTYKKDIQQALTDVATNLERIKNTKGQIDEAKSAQQLATIRFKNGVGTNLEITNASTNVQRAELTKLQYEYQLCLAKIELARLSGYQYW